MKKVVYWFFALTILVGFNLTFAAQGQSQLSDAQYQQQVLYYVNEYRVKHHRSPLKLMSSISKIAETHSAAMAQKRVPFGHQNFSQRISVLYKQIKHCQGGAENVAYYKYGPKQLVDAWIASPGHRRNILGDYNLTGIGIAHDSKGWGYYTQLFLKSPNAVIS
ncbi:CAP domain-containing protein [Legionella yabuuchiae]|uniref:CAP domain-containing protein n=1 Tax=Legionella yabuuchiae TaxID=376727 RepID=UPI001F5F2852|nr:CAP domain-containing protein [Legionella yabuuchiae]